MRKKNDKPFVEYRPMTRKYIVRSMIMTGCFGLLNNFELIANPAYLGGVVLASALFGGYLWGWVFWRLGLYRLYPRYLDDTPPVRIRGGAAG